MYGDIIKKIRKMKGFTQKEVYTNVVSKTFYSDYEAGKYSISIEKFEGILENLGISYAEFEFFRNKAEHNKIKHVSNQIDELYKKGKFQELYEIYESYYLHRSKDIRYLAAKAYLLVLITNTNFYKFSRDAFNEIVGDLEFAKMWTLKEIKLAKLVLLSISEKNKDKANIIFNRTLKELHKYQEFDIKVYYEEMNDLYFNRIQSLLVINDIDNAKALLKEYHSVIQKCDDLHLLIQHKFITIIVGLYLEYPKYEQEAKQFLEHIKVIPTSESRFYGIIFEIHHEKAKNYYFRYGTKSKI